MSNNDLKFTTAGEYIKTEASSDSLLIDSTDQDMNERIKELAEQAGFMDYWFSESGDDCERELKKFAELIINECASIYEGVYTDQQRPERIDTRIKQHFGVEE
jgi:hypothetical protein